MEYTRSSIYGFYVRQVDLINGVLWYRNDARSISWDNLNNWNLKDIHSSSVIAQLNNTEKCLPKISNQKWNVRDGNVGVSSAGNTLKVRCGYKPKGINTFVHQKQRQTFLALCHSFLNFQLIQFLNSSIISKDNYKKRQTLY